jgi:hypothetical protein
MLSNGLLIEDSIDVMHDLLRLEKNKTKYGVITMCPGYVADGKRFKITFTRTRPTIGVNMVVAYYPGEFVGD